MIKEGAVPAFLWGLGVVFVAGIVHIASILILPWVAPHDAFARVASAAPVNAVQVLPRPTSHQNPVPFRDPALATAVCRYDLRQGPVRIAALVNDSAFLAVSFHGRFGLPFYGLNDRASNDGKIEVLLLSASQLEKLEAADSEDDPVRDVRVTSPTPEGFVQFDVLPRVGGYSAAEQALKSVSCHVERGL